MARVHVNTKKLNTFSLLPVGWLEAVIIEAEWPYQAPWDEENFGLSLQFRITDENIQGVKGRRMNMFCSTTEDKPFNNRYAEVLKGLGFEPDSEWDTDQLEGMPCRILIENYFSEKHQEERQSVNQVTSA